MRCASRRAFGAELVTMMPWKSNLSHPKVVKTAPDIPRQGLLCDRFQDRELSVPGRIAVPGTGPLVCDVRRVLLPGA